MKLKLNFSIILISLFFSVSEKGYSQIPKWSWAKAIYTKGNLYCQIAVDINGNVYSAGYFTGTRDFDPGPGTFNMTSAGSLDVFISKLDIYGNFVWAKRLGGPNYDQNYSIAVDDSGNVYTTGSFESTADFDPGAGVYNLNSAGAMDIYISKLNSFGNFLWAKRLGSTGYDIGYSVFFDPTGNGNIYTAGYFYGSVDFDPGPGIFNLTSVGFDDIFISKLNTLGNFVWAKKLGIGAGHSIALDNSGNIYTTGYFSSTSDFDPGPTTFNLTSMGNTDIFISKLDSSGNFVWAKSIGGIAYEKSKALSIDASANVYTIGHFNNGSYNNSVDFDPGVGVYNLTSVGNQEIFILKLDSSGNFAWAKGIGGVNEDDGRDITIDTNSNIYITGYFSEMADFSTDSVTFSLKAYNWKDVFIAKLNPSGNFLWAKSIGGMDADIGYSIVCDQFGDLLVAGCFQSPAIAFDSISLTNNNGTSNFIAKLSEKPCNVITCTINPTVKISNVSSNNCNNGKITVHLNGTFQAFPHLELYDSLNTIISSVKVSPGILNHEFANLGPGSYTVKVFDNNCCEQVIPALVKCASLTTGFQSTHITSFSARLKWKVASCVVSYRVQYRMQGDSVWNDRCVSGSQGYRTIVNLSPSTTYEWRIANMCYGSNTYSPIKTASPIQTFTTAPLREGEENISSIAYDAFEINLFPNPATYTLTVNFETEETNAKVKVINTVGQLVFEKQSQSEDGTFQEELDISKYDNGMYLLLVGTQNGVSRRKFAKE